LASGDCEGGRDKVDDAIAGEIPGRNAVVVVPRVMEDGRIERAVAPSEEDADIVGAAAVVCRRQVGEAVGI
jgi:hypothetical protein